MGKAVALKGADFEKEVLQSDVPVVVDFWAVWCGPCRVIAPVMEEIATDFEGRAKVFKIDVDEEQDIAGQFNVMSIPALFFFKDGKVADQLLGAVPKSEVASRLNRLVEAAPAAAG